MNPFAILAFLAPEIALAAPPVLCLPAGMPALSTLRVASAKMVMIGGLRPSDRYVATSKIYTDDVGHFWNVISLFAGDLAIIDDHPNDEAADDWYIDPGMVTDENPARVKPEAKPTCLWRRRANT